MNQALRNNKRVVLRPWPCINADPRKLLLLCGIDTDSLSAYTAEYHRRDVYCGKPTGSSTASGPFIRSAGCFSKKRQPAPLGFDGWADLFHSKASLAVVFRWTVQNQRLALSSREKLSALGGKWNPGLRQRVGARKRNYSPGLLRSGAVSQLAHPVCLGRDFAGGFALTLSFSGSETAV